MVCRGQRTFSGIVVFGWHLHSQHQKNAQIDRGQRSHRVTMNIVFVYVWLNCDGTSMATAMNLIWKLSIPNTQILRIWNSVRDRSNSFYEFCGSFIISSTNDNRFCLDAYQKTNFQMNFKYIKYNKCWISQHLWKYCTEYW